MRVWRTGGCGVSRGSEEIEMMSAEQERVTSVLSDEFSVLSHRKGRLAAATLLIVR
jgi:hypothetical protein